VPTGVRPRAPHPKVRQVLPAAPAAPADRGPPAPTSAREAFGTVLEPTKHGEGFRTGWLGDSRQGKTYAARALVEWALETGAVDLAVVLDDKLPTPQYPGTYRANVAALKAALPAPEEDASRLVFRGHTMRTGERCTSSEIAGWALERAMERTRVLVVVDELRRAASPAGREWADRPSETARLFVEGGGLGTSIMWTTQTPQRIPAEAFDQSETLGLFRIDGRGISYLDDLLLLDRELVRVLPRLEKGVFVLWRKGEPWDRKTYRVDW
jgi:hypothetical protein